MSSIDNRIVDSSELGALVRARRRELKLSQQALADSIGVSRRVIGELERGKPSLRLQIAVDAVNALGLTLRAEER